MHLKPNILGGSSCPAFLDSHSTPLPMHSIKPAFYFPITIRCSVLFKHSIISGGITIELLPVTCLVAFLCLAVWQEPLPSGSFEPFTGHNSLSAFTVIFKDGVAMFVGMLVLRKPSPLGGAVRWRFRTGPIIDQPKPGLPTNTIKKWLGNWFKWIRLWGNGLTATTNTRYTFVGTETLVFTIWWILPNVVPLDFWAGIPFGIVTWANIWGRVWCRNIWLQGLVCTW